MEGTRNMLRLMSGDTHFPWHLHCLFLLPLCYLPFHLPILSLTDINHHLCTSLSTASSFPLSFYYSFLYSFLCLSDIPVGQTSTDFKIDFTSNPYVYFYPHSCLYFYLHFLCYCVWPFLRWPVCILKDLASVYVLCPHYSLCPISGRRNKRKFREGMEQQRLEVEIEQGWFSSWRAT